MPITAPEPCPCVYWVRTGALPFTRHHPMCPHLDLAAECLEQIRALLDVLDHGDARKGWECDQAAWRAYERACFFVGRSPTDPVERHSEHFTPQDVDTP